MLDLSDAPFKIDHSGTNFENHGNQHSSIDALSLKNNHVKNSKSTTSALPIIEAGHCNQNKNGKVIVCKISLKGRTKEGLDDDRFQKRWTAIKRVERYSCHRRTFFKKRNGRYGSFVKRSLRKKVFKMMNKQDPKEREADKTQVIFS